MKAIIKGTEAVISVQPIYSADGLHIEQFVNIANGDLFQPHTVDIIPNDTDWDALRNQAAISAMQGFIQSKNTEFYSLEELDKWQKIIINNSVVMANALIEELKKK